MNDQLPPHSPLDFSWITYAWVIFVSWLGGLVNFWQKVKAGVARPFNLIELFGEIATSGFVGLLTFWISQAHGMDHLTAAPLVGIASHMGTRALWFLERWLTRKFGVAHFDTEDSVNGPRP